MYGVLFQRVGDFLKLLKLDVLNVPHLHSPIDSISDTSTIPGQPIIEISIVFITELQLQPIMPLSVKIKTEH